MASPDNYAAVKRQLAELEAKAARLRAAEKPKVIAQILALMAEYGVTQQELSTGATAVVSPTLPGGKKKATAKAPKYRDPKSGATWTGHGKRPQWYLDAIAAGTAPEAMTIGKQSASAPASPVAKAKPAAKSTAQSAKKASKGPAPTAKAVSPVKPATKSAPKPAAAKATVKPPAKPAKVATKTAQNSAPKAAAKAPKKAAKPAVKATTKGPASPATTVASPTPAVTSLATDNGASATEAPAT